jgi:hypothetical protein
VLPVARLTSDKAAPATVAPVGSVIVPLKPPVTMVCADNPAAKNRTTMQLIRTIFPTLFIIIFFLPLSIDSERRSLEKILDHHL